MIKQNRKHNANSILCIEQKMSKKWISWNRNVVNNMRLHNVSSYWAGPEDSGSEAYLLLYQHSDLKLRIPFGKIPEKKTCSTFWTDFYYWKNLKKIFVLNASNLLKVRWSQNHLWNHQFFKIPPKNLIDFCPESFEIEDLYI